MHRCGDVPASFAFEKFAPIPQDAILLTDQRPGRGGAQADDDAGLDLRQFGIQPRLAGGNFFIGRLLVNGRLPRSSNLKCFMALVT